MSTEPLIDRLTADLQPVRRQSPLRAVVALAALGVIEIVFVLTTGWMRHDMPHAMNMPSFWWKTISLGIIMVTGGTTTLLSLTPTRSPRRGLRMLGYAILAAMVCGWVVDATQLGLDSIWHRLSPARGLICVQKIIELSLPVALALGLIVRHGAPVDPPGTAWAAGIAASSWGALAFVLVCPFDDPLYVAVWYMLGCGVVSLATRLILPWLARW